MKRSTTPAVMVGLAIGDALGMPFETLDETIHNDLATWDGAFKPGTWHKLPAGQYTDDTQMATCLAESLITRRGFNEADIAKRYLAWSKATPHGMGGTTRRAMTALAKGIPPSQSGVAFDNPDAVGSAPPMRAAPLGVFEYATPFYNLSACCRHDAYITHLHPEAHAASLAVALAVLHALREQAPAEILRATINEVAKIQARQDGTMVHKDLELVGLCLAECLAPDEALDYIPEQFSRRGNARSIVATAFYCALAANNFREGVIMAVKLGGDADTRGAIAGAILGARFGLEGLPNDYKVGLKDYEKFKLLDYQLLHGQVS